MSLSEQDREILLQEIQQIQQTLEATGCGRNFDDEDQDDKSESDDDDDDNADLYYPASLKQEEEIIVDDESNLQTTSAYSGSLYAESDNLSEVYDNLSTPNNQLSLSHLASTPTGVDKVSILTDVPQSSISAKLKQRIKLESEFSAKSPKSKGKKKISNHDGSVDSTKQMEKINMANLYVERLFGGFRNKKDKSSYQINSKYGKELKSDASLSSLENLLQVNRRYKELLNDELKKVELAIERNRRAQDEVEISSKEKEVKVATFSSLSRACIGRFGNPYFKDEEGMPPPDNEDTLEKKRNWKVNPFVRGSKYWKKSETEALEEGVYYNNLELRLEPWMKKLKDFDRDYKENLKKGIQVDRAPRHKITQEIDMIKEQPRSEILKDPSQIDFFKISKNYLPTRDEFECRVQWCNVAHPAINQTKFSKEEDGKLIKLAERNKNFRWEDIAKELGTRRTPIQCLQRFQRTLNPEMIKTVWDKEDDAKLTSLVRLHGYNWALIASLLGNRTGDQCLHRWLKTLDPHIKRGKWSEDEDKLLIDAVQKLGLKNWKEVRKLVPGRTDAQCRERYVSTLDPSKDWGAFTEEEDKKIVELVGVHGLGKWATIAKEFPNRRDNQIWRRYTQLEQDKYHLYRRGVIWKRRSVMNYFLHRTPEKREYGLEELDVSYSPSLTHMESRKIERMREELLKCGYTEDEITKKLARMHYEGLFSKSLYKPRQRPYSQGRCRRILDESRKKDDNALRKSLVQNVVQILANTKDPENELPDLPGGELKRKTKVQREMNVDGCYVIKRCVPKKKGRKETWMEGTVNGDVFRRKCYELIYKYKNRTIWFDDVKQRVEEIYKSIQVDDNSFYHKQILAIYTEFEEKLREMETKQQEIKDFLLGNNEVPIEIEEGIVKIQRSVESSKPAKIGRPKGSKNGCGNTKTRKLTKFKQMVLAASRDLSAPETSASMIYNDEGSPCPSVAETTTIDHTNQSESENTENEETERVELNDTTSSPSKNLVPSPPTSTSQTSKLEARLKKLSDSSPEKSKLRSGDAYELKKTQNDSQTSLSDYLSADSVTDNYSSPSKSQNESQTFPSPLKRLENTSTQLTQNNDFTSSAKSQDVNSALPSPLKIHENNATNSSHTQNTAHDNFTSPIRGQNENLVLPSATSTSHTQNTVHTYMSSPIQPSIYRQNENLVLPSPHKRNENNTTNTLPTQHTIHTQNATPVNRPSPMKSPLQTHTESNNTPPSPIIDQSKSAKTSFLVNDTNDDHASYFYPNSTADTSLTQDPQSSTYYTHSDSLTHDPVYTHNPSERNYAPITIAASEPPNTPSVNVSSTPVQNQTPEIQEEDPNQSFLSDQLKTFTLLLQALHVDTTGVMGALSNTTSPKNTSRPSSSSFPTCYPLSPNSASLLGFRKLLLHRRILGEIVRKEQLTSEKFGIHTRNTNYRETRAYDALRKRFRSLFTWPAFLATFVPKYPKQKSPSKVMSNVIKNHVKILPNRTLEITPSMTISGSSNSVAGTSADNSSIVGTQPTNGVENIDLVSSAPTIGNENQIVESRSGQQNNQNEKNRTSESTSSFIDEYLQNRKRKIDRKFQKIKDGNKGRKDSITNDDDDEIVVKRKRKKRSSRLVTTSSSSCEIDNEKDCFVDEYVKKRRRKRENRIKTKSRNVIRDSSSSHTSPMPSLTTRPYVENNTSNIVSEGTIGSSHIVTNEARLKSLVANYVSKRKSQTQSSIDGDSSRHGESSRHSSERRRKKMKKKKLQRRDERRIEEGIFMPPAMSVKSESDTSEQRSLDVEIVESGNL